MNKNKKLLMILKAKNKIKQLKKANPGMSDDEIAEKVVHEMFGAEGTELLKQVKKNPDKYKDFMKDIKVKL